MSKETKARVANAFLAMKAIGFSEEKVMPVLKDLLRVSEINWAYIEKDNYKVLANAMHGADAAEHSKEFVEPSKGTKTRFINAFRAMKAIGFSRYKLMPVLKNLLRLHYKNWDYIEEENYKVLTDAMFKRYGAEAAEQSEKIVDSEAAEHSLEIVNSDPERSLKRLRREHGDGQSSSENKPKISVPRMSVDTPKDTNELPETCLLSLSDGTSKGMPHSTVPIAVIHPAGSYIGSLNNVTPETIKSKLDVFDISNGKENVVLTLVNEVNDERPPSFNYLPENVVFENAYVNFTLARIGKKSRCPTCFGDCLSSSEPCACARESGGEFAYTPGGLVKEDFLEECISMNHDLKEHGQFFCKVCPNERAKGTDYIEPCKGHTMRKFIKECWRKCGCDKQCGNRVVQRGMTCNLQVFMTAEGKGWGLRTLVDLPKGAFVCEYVGEIVTNSELYDRVLRGSKGEKHSYAVNLDAGWGAEGVPKDKKALCLDATYHGNAGRFINHRCYDSNLVEIPVEVETPDHHYYHLAFFTTRKVNAMEELTRDYGIDFDEHDHPFKAFHCQCGSKFCRNMKRSNEMFSGRYNKKAKGRNLTQTLSKPLQGITYPPEFSSKKNPISQTDESVSLKRHGSPSQEPTPALKKARDPTTIPPIPIANHVLFTQSVLGQLNDESVLEFIQGLSTSVDRRRLEKMPDQQLLVEACTDLARFVTRFSALVPLARQGSNDLKLQEAYDGQLAESGRLRELLKEHKQKASAKIEEEVQKAKAATERADSLALELEALKAKTVQEVRSAHMEGHRAGREEFLWSPEGLAVLEHIRRAAEKSTLRSEAFINMVVDVIPFYGEVFVQRAKATVAGGQSLDAFNLDKELGDVPDHDLLKLSADDLAVTKYDTRQFVDYALGRPLQEWIIEEDEASGDPNDGTHVKGDDPQEVEGARKAVEKDGSALNSCPCRGGIERPSLAAYARRPR